MPPGTRPTVGVRIGKERRRKLEWIAHRESEPGDQKTISDVVRDAVDDHIDDYDEPIPETPLPDGGSTE